MEIYIGTPQVQIGNEIQKVDAESQTDLELLWDFIKLLRREGRYPEELEKPKRKRKTIIQTFGQMSDENSCSTDAPGLLSIEKDGESQVGPVRTAEELIEMFGDTEGDEKDEDYVPELEPRRGRGRPRGHRTAKAISLRCGSRHTEATELAAMEDFCSYLQKIGKHTDVFTYSKAELAEILGGYYCNWLTGCNFTKRSIQSVVGSLRRVFLRDGVGPTHELDIKLDPEFELANNALRAAIEVSLFLKSDPLSHVPVTIEDMIQIYQSGVLQTTSPEGLLNKVIFETILLIKDVQVMELYTLIVDDLVEGIDEAGAEWFQFRGSRFHLFKSDNPLCPYTSMKKFLENRPKDTVPKKAYQTRLFLMPNSEADSPENSPWYSTSSIGKAPLKTFMQKISECVGLPMLYTNFGLRTTPIETWEAAMEVILSGEESNVITVVSEGIETSSCLKTQENMEILKSASEDLPNQISVVVEPSGEISVRLGATSDPTPNE
ncbi:uncharacterized protein LOC136039789 [Artemia franciscana]|uniref:uncharacterized protein LOC136039789 n=1 Tax=Artemia franciscana TaxID=6661 RepID=UPI0032D9F6AB